MPSWSQAADGAVALLQGVAPGTGWTRLAGAALAIGGRGLDFFTNRRLARDPAPSVTDLLDQQAAWLQRRVDPTPTAPASRYLAEEGKQATDDTDCFNCASAHLAAMAGALDRAATRAAQTGSCDATCATWMNLAVQEPGILLEHDWPEDKTWPTDQQAVVDRYRPQVEAILVAALGTDETADARSQIALAAAGLKESTRFTKSGDPVDHPEVEKRRLKAEQRLALAERADVTAFQGTTADDLRHLRQQVSGGITDPDTLTQVAQRADHLAHTVSTPAFAPLTPDQLRTLAQKAQALQEQFAAERRQHEAPAINAGLPPGSFVNRTFTDPADPTLRALLGATPQTEAAVHNLLRLDAMRQVPVRLEELPAVIEDGQYAGQILGAYYPAGHAILLGPQVLSEDPEDVNTIAEETAHSLLHNRACDIYPPMDVPYLEIPEEREAKTATLLALLATGLPSETEVGHPIPDRDIRTEAEAALADMDPLMRHRTHWAAHILATAMEGRVKDAADLAATCPTTLPKEAVS